MRRQRLLFGLLGLLMITGGLWWRWPPRPRRHLPPAPERTCVVHGDFRNGNLIVGEDGLRAALDWEVSRIGDPMEDMR